MEAKGEKVGPERTNPAAGMDAHALVIGVSRYQRIASLPVVQDAQDVASVLSNPSLCGYSPDSVTTLLDVDATRASVLAALSTIAQSAGQGASVFIYFSGHGGRVTDGPFADSYLMPVDATWRTPEDIARTAISGVELSEKLRALAVSRVTVVLDCCRAAGIASPKDAQASALDHAIPAHLLAVVGAGRGRAVVAASRADGLAFAYEGRRNSVFTHYLLEGLRGAAVGTGGLIRVCDLFHYVQQQVRAEIPDQCPVFKAELEENYPLALYRGGEVPPFTAPKGEDGCIYDAFVSYRTKSADGVWVEKELVPRLEALGLRVSLAERDFRLGAPRIREMERAVEQSRYTVAVFSPSYLDGAFEEFQTLLAQHQSLEQKAPRFVPLMRVACRPPLGIRATEWLDVSEGEFTDATAQRLARRLREPYRMPLSA